MDLLKFFHKVLTKLNESKVAYALAGGLIASTYRLEKRLTMDLDFLLLSQSDSQNIATNIIKSFDLKPHIIRKADLEGGPLFAIKQKKTTPMMIAGRSEKDKTKFGLDFILPEMPWFDSALKRAQLNNIDFGFGPVPCMTVEDVILSKFLSANQDFTRFKDLDDLQSIFKANHQLDIPYLYGQMTKLEIAVPKQIKDLVPKPLLMASKKIK